MAAVLLATGCSTVGSGQQSASSTSRGCQPGTPCGTTTLSNQASVRGDTAAMCKVFPTLLAANALEADELNRPPLPHARAAAILTARQQALSVLRVLHGPPAHRPDPSGGNGSSACEMTDRSEPAT
jgi:hypothetical protein